MWRTAGSGRLLVADMSFAFRVPVLPDGKLGVVVVVIMPDVLAWAFRLRHSLMGLYGTLWAHYFNVTWAVLDPVREIYRTGLQETWAYDPGWYMAGPLALEWNNSN